MNLATLILILPLAAPAEDPFERYELENGIQVQVLYVPDAPLQVTFTCLPLGLRGDGPGRAQFAHLAEHMLIRAHDPDELAIAGLEFNGETLGQGLRLDTYAEPRAWKESLELQAAWLGAREFSAEVLEREKQRIEGEERFTVANRAVGKWAQAAWGQVVLGGLEHAALHGDVAGATLAQVARYVEEQVRIGPAVCLVSVGPIDPAELRAALAESHGSLPPAEAAATPARSEQPADPFAFGDGQATWDLELGAYLEWYPLPDASPADRAAALILAQRAHTLLLTAPDPALPAGRVLIDDGLVGPSGKGLLFALDLEPGADVAPLRAALARLLGRLTARDSGLAPLAFEIAGAAAQLGQVPDLAAQRKQLGANPAARYLEGNLVLGLVGLEQRSGSSLPELGAALRALEAERVEEIARSHLVPARRSSLTLMPRVDAAQGAGSDPVNAGDGGE